MMRPHVANSLLPRACSILTLRKSPVAFAPQLPLHMKRLMSATPDKGQQQQVVHDMVHFKTSTNKHPLGVEKLSGDKKFWQNPMQHSVWSEEELYGVTKTHLPTKGMADHIALGAVKFARWAFDTASFYKWGGITKDKVLNRAIFLETVAGVPGMCAGMIRHLRSLRRMDRDHGWIHTLLEEAENERMHLLTFVKLKQPGPVFRTSVLFTQGLFMNFFFFTYLVYPKVCHRFVGYLEEEAVKTYTDIIDAIDNGPLTDWKTEPAPQIAIDYWRMGQEATMRDLMLAVRADEANHRDVNHTLADLKPDQTNPYIYHHVPGAAEAKEAAVKAQAQSTPA